MADVKDAANNVTLAWLTERKEFALALQSHPSEEVRALADVVVRIVEDAYERKLLNQRLMTRARSIVQTANGMLRTFDELADELEDTALAVSRERAEA